MTSPAQAVPHTKRDFRQEVTDSIIRMLEEGVAPWQKPWQAAGAPHNPTTGNAYRGGNAIHLMATAIRRGFDDPRWMTYRQAAQQGWQVRQGEKGTQIEFWELKPGEAKREGAAEGGDQREARRLVHRVYTVFNAQQIAGIPAHQRRPHSPFEVAKAGEQILANSGARIHHDQHDRAFYSPTSDSIHLPPKNAFKDAPGFYGTALHELAHWTGHQSRLNRSTLTDAYRFGDTNYAREELRAELASVFLAAERGIPHDPASHASYVGSWVKALREDKNEIFRAAHDASAAADYLLALERERSVGEALEANPESLEPEQREAALQDESQDLKQSAAVLGESVDRANTEVPVRRDEDERDTTRRTTRYEPGNGTVLVHEKHGGDDRRTVVEAGVGRQPLPGAEGSPQSLQAAKEVTEKALGTKAKIHTALTDSGVYRGPIIGETELHLIQRLSPSSAVAHMKNLFEAPPTAGEAVTVAYSQGRAEVRALRQRVKAQGLGR